MSLGKPNYGGAMRSVADKAHVAYDDKNTPTRPTSGGPTLVLASVNVRKHTLILTGGLDRRSAPALEAEIERLCDEGVTAITLDLRELTYIDSIGTAVIAFRCRLCQRRGYDFALIPGSPLVQRAFERAGVIDRLPFEEDDVEPGCHSPSGASTANTM